MDLSLFFMRASRWSSPEDFVRHLSKVVMKKLENEIRAKKEGGDLFQAKEAKEFDDLFDEDSLFMRSKNPEIEERSENETRKY
ncbi:MAG: hypothetical protein JNM39_17910 [Bdellovibrionaceae bacterium]|nr:hypothetical protein [Pseudobdellovibrionaceae bacterium]